MAKENSLDSWIDPDRLRELLGDVRPGSLDRVSAPDDADEATLAAAEAMASDDSQDGTAADERLLPDEIPQRAFVKGVRPKKEVAAAAEPETVAAKPPQEEPTPPQEGPPPAHVPAPSPATRQGPPEINPLNLYFHSPAPSPEARAKAFVSWVRKTADAEAAFVVDAYGAAIASEPEADSVFLASLSNLADALGRGRDHFSRPDQNAMHLELDQGRILCVLQAKWDVATVALGMIRDRPLHREMAIRYREELAKLAQKQRRRPRD